MFDYEMNTAEWACSGMHALSSNLISQMWHCWRTWSSVPHKHSTYKIKMVTQKQPGDRTRSKLGTVFIKCETVYNVILRIKCSTKHRDYTKRNTNFCLMEM